MLTSQTFEIKVSLNKKERFFATLILLFISKLTKISMLSSIVYLFLIITVNPNIKLSNLLFLGVSGILLLLSPLIALVIANFIKVFQSDTTENYIKFKKDSVSLCISILEYKDVRIFWKIPKKRFSHPILFYNFLFLLVGNSICIVIPIKRLSSAEQKQIIEYFDNRAN